ncbi:Uncharacterized conserved protein, DUF1015 family [Marinitoga hydrogenitolerans DSM 16785]|uniref:Uncharacterized conserved protein, DUF1015 family n=1 Tax=Marinitoga hydrogenitolerans (strain DSM 16785 / JCM 12826 / AT1271) TaxID=1122195 RepID=A0A1M4U8P6_MARH1|nr:DUF1015 family protein [Marinitoga hydrogenitolerans]SHE52933.1 Uncharacterized conserved protein, DUF1015 family [Marinitoga hydrogenitolerans DSM 16785]
MSIIRPFKGLRPKKELVEEFSCPPYDVLEENEVKEIVSKHPNSFLRVTRAEVEFENDIDPHSEIVYKKAKENLENFKKDGVLVEEKEPALYFYRETWNGHSQTGIFATFSVEEYQKGLIKKHELTRQDKEDDRTKHIMILEAQTGPVFLTFKSKETIKDLINKGINAAEKIYDFVDEKSVHHELWVLTNKNLIEELENAFKDVESLYIADGHHRAAAASRTKEILKSKNPLHTGSEEYNSFMAVVFPHDELKILDYNRVVKDLNGLSDDDFMNKLSEYFEIAEAPESPYKPKSRHEFGMYINKKWYILKAKENIIDEKDPVKQLDVYILQNYLLSPILGIENPRKDPRIHFLGGIRGVKALEEWIDGKNWKVAFSMYPTSIEELMAVADADKTMPPKSTWFEPKLRSGLLIHEI